MHDVRSFEQPAQVLAVNLGAICGRQRDITRRAERRNHTLSMVVLFRRRLAAQQQDVADLLQRNPRRDRWGLVTEDVPRKAELGTEEAGSVECKLPRNASNRLDQLQVKLARWALV